jgi:hypothetical protein
LIRPLGWSRVVGTNWTDRRRRSTMDFNIRTGRDSIHIIFGHVDDINHAR